MPIRIDHLESGNTTPVRPGTNEQRVMEVLAAHPNLAFTPTELVDLAEIPTGSINKTLSRLKDKGLVRHFEAEGVWAVADDSALADYLGAYHSEDALGDAFDDLADDWYSDNPDWAEDLPDFGPVERDDEATESDSE